MRFLAGSAPRASKGPSKPKPPPYWRALPCILLAVDPADLSGWAILNTGHLVRYGELDPYDAEAVRAVIREALVLSETTGVPLVMVCETWPRGGGENREARNDGDRRGLQQWASAVAARKVWVRTLQALAPRYQLPYAPKRVLAHVSTWRQRVLGRSRLSTALAKEMAAGRARAAFPGQTSLEDLRVRHNAAEAICIGLFGAHAGEVGKVLPKRHMAKHGLQRPGERV